MGLRDCDSIVPPRNIDELDARWMTEMLQVQYPMVEVRHLCQAQVRHGSETTVRVVLNYNRAGHEAGLPATMYVKGQWTEREPGTPVTVGAEARFYQDLAPLLNGINVPFCYAASVHPEGGAAIVMEDLLARNAILGSAGDSFTPSAAYDLADQLAQLHGLWFDRPELEHVDWLDGRQAIDVEMMADQEIGIFGSFKDWWWAKRTQFEHNKFLPAELLDRNIVKRALVNKYRLEDVGPKCVTHGDPHLGNLFFSADGRPGLYDWSTMVGRWANDLNYAIVGSLEVEDRREHDQPILRHYLERLAAHGGPRLDWDEAWLAWRRQNIHGYMYMLCSPRQQPEELIAIETERFGRAAMDYDMLGVLNAL